MVQEALHRITLSIPRGTCILITGPSGAGKTSLCYAASGILRHEFGGKLEGNIEVAGKEVGLYPSLSDLAAYVGMIFDDPEAQMIFTTVEEEILMVLEHRGLTPEAIREKLETILSVTHLTEFRNRSPHHLSGGQKQRVAIAAALALGTDVLILDEPTSELDDHMTERIVTILRHLRDEGKTLVIIEHKIASFSDMTDSLVVLNQGQVLTAGKPADILRDDTIRSRIIPDFSGIKKPGSGRVDHDLTPVIEVNNLSFLYQDITALNNVTTRIFSGEMIAIVGENGSGKTTLVKHFNGLLKPTNGDVIVKRRNTKSCSIGQLAREVGLVFQNPDHMFFADTVRDEVAFGLNNLGLTERDNRIDSALSQVGLVQTKDLYPRWLSRGERQRLAIACVIAMQPSVIILDEPTTGLDAGEARSVMEILTGLREKGHTIIIITHNRQIAESCADRIIQMDHGTIIEDTCTGE